jgi:hypothetical protein
VSRLPGLALGGLLLLLLAGALAIDPVSERVQSRSGRLTADLIPHSMMPSSDLPLVDIETEKIP